MHPSRWLLIVFLALAAGGGAFWFLRPAKTATVTVANETDRTIQWVAIDHARGGERLDELAPRVHRTVRFKTGESDFTVRVHFADGSDLAQKRVYVEAGYRFRFAVRDSGIDVRVSP